ncbi:MAG: metallophosphoesterase family protein [Bacteroidota bacterium]
MSLIAVGDIHGCAATLRLLIKKLDLGPDDHLLFIGDYIDRGPDSKGVIDYLLDLREWQPCTFLRGNHEAFMLDYIDKGSRRMWEPNGGLATLNSYARDTPEPFIPPSHEAFLRETKLFVETPDFFFVHAGAKPDFTIAQNTAYCGEETFLWERNHLDVTTYAWEKCVVCGHTPVSEPINEEQLINIDTGCVYFNRPDLGLLTAVRLPERTFVSVRYAEVL